ncbi:hypothetical protein [Breoghania sp.]|uniref:hypothetical protein n=1 Tax=Breoghania sp. TaxID=2065378 RepID=UPI0026276F72|nr:hypothetical protein [Breoghania sp.]MDJ0933555.1 hypothetical protein [Breoghania sp.]
MERARGLFLRRASSAQPGRICCGREPHCTQRGRLCAAAQLVDRSNTGTVPCTAQVSVSRVALGTAELAIRLHGPSGSAAVIVDVAAESGSFIRMKTVQPAESDPFCLTGFNPYRSLISAAADDPAGADSCVADGIAAQRLMLKTLSISQSQ